MMQYFIELRVIMILVFLENVYSPQRREERKEQHSILAKKPPE
jgi:hypothetical protein